MIASDRVAALAALDRAALVALLALAVARGQHRSGIFNDWPHDPLIRDLMDDADLLIRMPVAMREELQRWNAWAMGPAGNIATTDDTAGDIATSDERIRI